MLYLHADDPIPEEQLGLKLGFSPSVAARKFPNAKVEYTHGGPEVGRAFGAIDVRRSPIDDTLKLGTRARLDLTSELGRKAHQEARAGLLRCSIHYRTVLDPQTRKASEPELLGIALLPTYVEPPHKRGCTVEVLQSAEGGVLVTQPGTVAVDASAPPGETTKAPSARPPPVRLRLELKDVAMSTAAAAVPPPSPAPSTQPSTPATQPPTPGSPMAQPSTPQQPQQAPAPMDATPAVPASDLAAQLSKLNQAQLLQELIREKAQNAELARRAQTYEQKEYDAKLSEANKRGQELAARAETLKELGIDLHDEQTKKFFEEHLQVDADPTYVQHVLSIADRHAAARKELADKDRMIAEQAAQLAVYEQQTKKSRTGRDIYATLPAPQQQASKAAEMLQSDLAALNAQKLAQQNPALYGQTAPLLGTGGVVTRAPDGRQTAPLGRVQLPLAPLKAGAGAPPPAQPIKQAGSLVEVAQGSSTNAGAATGDTVEALLEAQNLRNEQMSKLFRNDGLYMPNGRPILPTMYDPKYKETRNVQLTHGDIVNLAHAVAQSGIGETQTSFQQQLGVPKRERGQ